MKKRERLSIFILLIFLFQGGTNVLVPETLSALNDIDYQVKTNDPLDTLYSDKKLGSFIDGGDTFFRLFAPNAHSVTLALFENASDEHSKDYTMKRDKQGVWEVSVEGNLDGKFYGYRIAHQKNDEGILCIDPYAKAFASYKTYYGVRKSIVIDEHNFDWEGDTWIKRDWRDLIIYEMHIKDLTAHPSAGAEKPGTYQGLIEKGITGGIDYIKSLGVNTVELLPIMEFAEIEAPYNKKMYGKKNTWNPYETNHWGYMTAGFFAPESYYAYSGNEGERNYWEGTDAKAVNDLKEVVKAFHKEGIAVMMDVVYNHVSEYESGGYKQIDKEYYFRLDENGDFIALSGCGNDFKTERPMTRKLIVESVLYWMTEYHIDGFRFDLGHLLDWQTIETIIREARKINPAVVFVCEPWGGGYDPNGFSMRGWGTWNDQIRNGIKGENPFDGQGWLLGKWYGNNDPARIQSYIRGTLAADEHGLFQKKEHSVNYLTSHDGYTLGDFIRLALDLRNADEIIKNTFNNARISPAELKLHKLAALFLLTSQGIIMIHEGQEYGRSKVIPYDIDVPDTKKGTIDHNSYEKDNETNYLNFEHAKLNKVLVNYYKGLIALRQKYPAFRRAHYQDIQFLETPGSDFALAYRMKYEDTDFLVLYNANRDHGYEFTLPEGSWNILASPDKAGTKTLATVTKRLNVEPSGGYVLLFEEKE